MTSSPSPQSLRAWIRRFGRLHLQDENITSVGVGHRVRDGVRTDELCIQFTVVRKLTPEQIATAPTRMLPEHVTLDNIQVGTDVLERTYQLAAQVVPEAASDARRSRVDPLVPGVSISHPSVSAGTAGAIVHDRSTGRPALLSNWHVLHGPEGSIGDPALQPGTHDDNSGAARNRFGTLLRSHLGAAGDAALASIEGRGVDPTILDLDVVPDEVADPELGDRVIKSGRTTGVSHGVVTRVDTMVSLDYGGDVGEQAIGCFEIEPDPRRASEQGQLSDGGDSGAAWMLKSGNGRTSSRLVGLHFAGSDDLSGAEQALACYASSVREVLGFSLSAETAAEAAAEQSATRGYDPDFLEHQVLVPQLSDAQREDGVEVDGDVLVPYTHFSLVQSRDRRFARFVAWNIDGGRMLRLDRNGIDFREDPRIPSEAQAGEELYARNDLDRGHIARRADLVWGVRAEAQQANEDSFFFTNIAPQMDAFNQSGRGGVWGGLENSLFDQAEVQDLRVSVVGGPIFTDEDREYRGFRIPHAFFKAVYYVSDGELQVRAFILAQDLDSLESLDLREFETHRVSLDELGERTGLTFAPAADGGEEVRAQSLGERVVRTTADIDW